MHKYSKLLVLVTGTVILIVLSGVVVNAQLGPFNPASSLLHVSSEDMSQIAQEYTVNTFQVVSGTPTVLLSRSVTIEELPKLGLPEIAFGGETPPLHIVALAGDFDVRGLSPSATASWRVNYIVYVYDLKAGVPSLTLVSPDGGEFRTLLNDPSLPVVPVHEPDVMSEHMVYPTPVPVAPPAQLPYGSTAPAVSDPATIPPEE